MSKLRDKYDIVLAIATIVISLSAFKEELSAIHFDLLQYNISITDYLFGCVLGFSLSLYLYLIDKSLEGTKIWSSNIFSKIIFIAYWIHITVLFSPIMLIMILLLKSLVYEMIGSEKPSKNEIQTTLFVVLTVLGNIITLVVSYIKIKARTKNILEEYTELKTKELEESRLLIRNGHYSHAILELFKAITNHINTQLLEKGYRVPEGQYQQLLPTATKNGIITVEDLDKIDSVRKMRNEVAHKQTEYTKEEAEEIYEFAKEFLKK